MIQVKLPEPPLLVKLLRDLVDSQAAFHWLCTSMGLDPCRCSVRSVGVVLNSMLFSQKLGLVHQGEQLKVQEFIPKPVIERFNA